VCRQWRVLASSDRIWEVSSGSARGLLPRLMRRDRWVPQINPSN
jgi:hypothetical protein